MRQKNYLKSYWICGLPFLLALAVWYSPLAFVPVPWPDDSAFYFVAKEFFKWPPRWVMLPQAPFEPTYRIYNFNTMPLFPILIGLGRSIGIDGSFALKFWSLLPWALSGSLLGFVLLRQGLPWILTLAFVLALGLDPSLRWASVVVRPESLIGLVGIALVLGLALGFPKRFQARGGWDPIAALLAFGAYSHFNAIHLVFAVVALGWSQPRHLVRTGVLTALYLSPWIATVLWHFPLFVHQMTTQWLRLAVTNDWLSSPEKALSSLFPEMGSPISFPSPLKWTAFGLWFLIFLAMSWGLFVPLIRRTLELASPRTQSWLEAWNWKDSVVPTQVNLLPAGGWVLGSLWLWHTKPELWFIFYLHLSLWVFAALVMLQLWRLKQIAVVGILASLVLAMVGVFGYVNFRQAQQLSASNSWRWATYENFVECIDQQLIQLESDLGSPQPFRVWNPTFPDVTIELSRRHPEWDFSRTNDFHNRVGLAIQHGKEVEAVVVTETLGWTERNVTAPISSHPEIQSIWMTWKEYFLYQLWKTPDWKTNQFLCQRGRWQAFLYMKEVPKKDLINLTKPKRATH